METGSPADKMNEALLLIKERVADPSIPWLVGGSTGLLLQGVSLNRAPRDLDVYVDSNHAASMHEALKIYSIDEQVSSQTGIYRSILSHYEIAGIKVELVGGFEVRAMGSEYLVEAAYLYETEAVKREIRWDPFASQAPLDISIMPLVHELIFNVLRDRPDRYEAIAAFCRSVHPLNHTRLLEKLLERNRIAPEVAQKLRLLLGQEGGTSS